MTRRARLLLGPTLIAAIACSGSGGGGEPAGPNEPPGATRSYRMGWAPTPPRGTTQSIIATAQEMARVSELALVQQHVPWAPLLDGTQTMEEAAQDVENLTGFLRGLGLEIVYLLDPLDGLNRTAEPPDLVARGRSIAEPEIRALHVAWALEMARRIRPAWYGLGSEVNTLAAHGDPALYAEIVALVNELAPEIRAASPATRTFVSFQVDDAWGIPPFPPSEVDHFALIDDFDVDALGLSSYPVFVFSTPAEIPADYFARFDAATTKPLLMVEGGWSSAAVGAVDGTPAEQADYFRRMVELLDGVDALVWVMLFYADLDLATYGLPPDREAGLASFSRMGIVDTELRPKPAFDIWQEAYRRPLAAP